jgi:ACS family tartrate transporter-like MFS transporter
MAVGCVLAGIYAGTWMSVAGLSLMTAGLYASNAHLFPLPAVFLSGPALASGIAWVNSVGILGGSVSPPVMGWIKDHTGSYAGGLYALAGFAVMAAIVSALCVRETPATRLAPATAAGI